MNINNETKIKRFFGAANGYCGFKNYFDKIFDLKKYTKIFVIKGGPGTGKSTFMRRVSKHFLSIGANVEEILCSSDPSSLDGVIITAEDGKVAFLDGTSPHERDAKIPGAIDEIINLGENFDTEKLAKNRDLIIKLSEDKSIAYKNAYSYMKIAGEAFDFSKRKYLGVFDHEKTDKKIAEIFSRVSHSKKSSKDVRLVSSFGKQGFKTIDTLDTISKKKIDINGNIICSQLFLTKLSDEALKTDVSCCSFPSPLSPTLTEAVYFPEEDLLVKADKQEAENEFMTESAINTVECEIAAAIELESIAKTEAVRWFNEASKMHFKLEEIYQEAVDFKKNDEILEKKIQETEYLCSLKN